MTQQPQEGFDRSVEDARRWMRAVQEQLQINDNTQGPRTALEARLRETEVCGGRGLDNPAALALSPPVSGLRLLPSCCMAEVDRPVFLKLGCLGIWGFKCRLNSARRWTCHF